MLAIFICLFLAISTNKKPSDDIQEETPSYVELADEDVKVIKLNWADLINIEFEGVSGNPSPNIIYGEIPSLYDRIRIVENKFENLWPELAQNNNIEEINGWNDKIDRYYKLNVASICTYDESNLSLKNGEEFIFKCESQDLKDLGYEFEDSYSIKIENLPINKVDEITDNEQNHTVIEPEPEPEIVYKNYSVDELGGVWMTSNMMDEDLSDEINDAKWKMIAVSSEDFEKAKDYAVKNNIDMILVDDDIEYSIEDNFTNGEKFKGAGNDK